MIIQRGARIITSAMNIQAWCQFFEASTRHTSSAASPMARRLLSHRATAKPANCA